MVLLFDAANSLIYKPSFYEEFIKTLNKHDYKVDSAEFKKNHKLISEIYHFPDRTSKEFYNEFNKELLYSLGIIATDNLLSLLFKNCSYLPWEKYDDTSSLYKTPIKKAILSNFHNGLNKIIEDKFPALFDNIIVSETVGLRKPEISFFENAIKALGVSPSEVIYFGDSIKLDMVPAEKAGIKSYLIDRENYFPAFKNRIQSLHEINNII